MFYSKSDQKENRLEVIEELKKYDIYLSEDYLYDITCIEQGSLFSQQMEILGDSLLNYLCVNFIYRYFCAENNSSNESYDEGQITRLKIMLVNRVSFNILGIALKLNLLCKNQKSPYLVGSLLECLFGGLIRIEPLEKVSGIFDKILSQHWHQIMNHDGNLDYKSALQSITQKYLKILPIYNTVMKNKLFITRCQIGEFITVGKNKNKKQSEQNAAKIMFFYLNVDLKKNFLFHY